MSTLVHYLKFRFAFLPVLEGLVLFQAMVLGYGIRLINDSYLVPVLHGLLFTAVMLLIMTGFGLYEERQARFRYTVQRVFSSYLLTLTVLAVVFYAFPGSQVGRGVFGIASVIALIGLLLVRWFAYRAGFINLPLRRFLVLGGGEIADDVARLLDTRGRLGGRRLAAQLPIAHFRDSEGGDRAAARAFGARWTTSFEDTAIDAAVADAAAILATARENAAARAAARAAVEAPVMTRPEEPSIESDDESAIDPASVTDASDLLSFVRERRITDIVVAVRELRSNPVPIQALLACKLNGVRVTDLATFHEEEQGLIKVDLLRASNLVYGSGFDQGKLRALVKRSFDILVSIGILTLAAPMMLIVALAVFFESGRPILFRQARVGENNREFMMLKFRSMRQDAESDGKARWAQKGDSRVTQVGRFIRATRLDELPQLINVLRGDMSFVGPRPERRYFVEQLEQRIPFYDIRHNVKPGVSGWAQVRLPYGASIEDAEDKLEYDLYYVKNHSLFLDLLILIDTIQVVLLGKGAR